MKWYNRISWWQYVLISIAIVVLAGLLEFWMGRVLMCKCGFIKFWHGAVVSSENSQHISDWYTFSHIIHGMIFYGFFRLVSRRKWPILFCLVAAIFVESAWEVFENSSFIINRYRESTIALDYFGDSVLNSISDIAFMIVGFWMAMKLPTWVTIFLIIVMELWVGYLIRDNLTLNVVMLVYPFDWIKNWQIGL